MKIWFKKYWRLGVLLVVGITLIVLSYAFWPIKHDLSYLQVPEGAYDVTIMRDTYGVPHIFGQTDADAAFGLAYAHSEDDFLTIQQSLLAARGVLARVYGPDAAPNDYMVEMLRIWDVVDARYEHDLATETQALFAAYAVGINHYASQHPDDVLLPELFPITEQLVAAVSVHKSPLFFGVETTLAELFADTRASEISPQPETWLGFGDYRFGSNVIAINQDRSADGSTFLAVNAHQPWEGPVTWYEAHVVSEEGWNMVGGLFPATPVVVHGHNQNLGWAFTVSHADLVDVFVLTINPENEHQYLYDGEWLDLEVRPAPIQVKLLGNIKITVNQETYWSEYGPVVIVDHGAYAVRYAGYGRVDIFQQLYQMNKAANFEEWQAAIYTGALPTFNVGYADDQGNIYYLYNANLPMREPGYDWSLYLPGESSSLKWTEYLPAQDLPQVLNPPSGFIQNSNSSPFLTTFGEGNPDAADFEASFGIETYTTNRAMRSLTLFSADPEITFEEFIAYKYDMYYDVETDVGDMIRMALAIDNPNLQGAQEVLKTWDFGTQPDNKQASLALLTLYALNDRADEMDASSLDQSIFTEEQVEESLIEASAYLLKHFDSLTPAWGDVQRLQRGDVDFALGGGPDILHAAYSGYADTGELVAYSGDSYILIVSWNADGSMESYSIHQFGSATQDENSPHYNDQSGLFANRELKPVWFTENDIRDNLEREYTPWD